MNNAAILSIKPVYANKILAGTKTIELRKSAMNLSADDVILVYSSAPDQCIAFWFRVKAVEALPVEEMWRQHREHLGIDSEDYQAYLAGRGITCSMSRRCDCYDNAVMESFFATVKKEEAERFSS